MRNKRLIAVVTALMLLFTQMNFIIGSAEDAAETAAPLYSESELASFESKREMLLDLGIFPKMDKEADDTLSRSEFAGVMEKVLGNHFYQAAFSENTYVDVKELTTNATAIVALKKMGIMVGVNNYEFKPDNKITYAQAVKVLVAGLGYKDLAEVSGGYYQGYLKKAIDLGLLRKGASDYDRDLTAYDAVMLIDAALEAKIPEMDSISEEYVTYSSDKERNLLSVYHDIYKIKGIMTDNGQTALSSESAAGLGNAVVGGLLMTGIDEKFTGLIGQSVVAYYKDGSDRTFLHAYSDEAKNDILVIDAYDLITDSPKFTKSNVVYKNSGGKTANAKISLYADFIYNGSAYPDFVGETLKISAGTLTLIDADADSVYETIVADVFEDYLVKTVNTITGAIYSNYSDPILYSEYDVVHFYNSAGEEAELADIKNDSLISVYKSKDYTKLLVYICDKSSTMVIDSITTDEDAMYIVVGEHTYRIGAWYMAAMADEGSSLKPPVAGAKYTVYLNIAGEAAMFTELQIREEYAYLLAVGTDSSNKLSGAKKAVKIVNEQGDCVTVSAAKSFTVIDSKGTHENDGDAVVNSADLYDKSGAFVPQIIRIKINTKGEFTKLEYDNTVPETGELPNGFDQSKFNKIMTGGVSLYSGFSSKNVNGKYIIDDTTKIFLIEETGTLTTTDETKITVVPYSDFKLTGLQVALYDTDQNWVAGAMLCSQSTTNYDDRTFTVVNSKVIIDEFGEERVQIDGYWKNNLWTFREHTPGVFDAALEEKGYTGVKRGDIFQIAFDNPKQEIAKAALVSSPSRDDTQRRTGVAPYASTDYAVTTWGQVVGYPVSGTEGSIGIMANGEYYVETLTSATYVTVFDTRSGEITKGDKTKIPTIGNVDAYGNIDIGDGSIMIYGFRQREHLCDILIVLK